MILRELFYFDKISTQPGEQKQYDPSEDQSIIKMDDTRKTRLSLKQINKARKAGEFHKDELSITWPIEDTEGNDLQLSPIGVFFILFFIIVLVLQTIGK